MNTQEQIEARLKRLAGMPEAQKAALKAFNQAQEWDFQCWNCRGKVTRKLADMHGPCPHCHVELSKRG